MNATEPSLYDRIGGEAAIEAITKAFYERVLADEELRPFFENTAMEKQICMQREFLSSALDGPVVYSGRPLSHAHQERGIKSRHFARFVGHFLDTLKAFGVSDEIADEVISRLNTRHNEITGNSY